MHFESHTVRTMRPYSWGEQPPKSASVVKLNTNENPYPPHASLKKLLSQFPYEHLRYYPDPTCSELIQAASSHYGFKPSRVAVGNGSDELIALVFKTFFNRQDMALIPEHTYSHYRTYAEAFGITASILPMKTLSVELEPLDRFRSKVFFLANPNTPTGLALEPTYIEHFVKRHEQKLFVIDEAYADFSQTNCLKLARRYPNVLVLRTASKAFSMCGIRLGFVYGHRQLIEAIDKVRDPYNINSLTQKIGVHIFKHASYYKKNCSRIVQTRERFSQMLQKLHFEVLPSQANFVFCRHRRITARDIFNHLRNKHIYVRFFDTRLLDQYLRITVGLPSQMPQVINELRAFLKK